VGKINFIRYADDFVILSSTYQDAAKAKTKLPDILKKRGLVVFVLFFFLLFLFVFVFYKTKTNKNSILFFFYL